MKIFNSKKQGTTSQKITDSLETIWQNNIAGQKRTVPLYLQTSLKKKIKSMDKDKKGNN